MTDQVELFVSSPMQEGIVDSEDNIQTSLRNVQ